MSDAPDARKRPIEPGLVARIARGVRYIVGGGRGKAFGSPGGRGEAFGSPGESAADWFGPDEPLPPSAPPSVAGRSFDFPVGFNLRTTPRTDERLGFHELRALADNYDLLRCVVETRKDQIARLDWSIRKRIERDEMKPGDADDPRLAEIEAFLRYPDREHDFGTWLRLLLEDLLVIDAPTLYLRRNAAGGLFALEVVDGATIKRVIDPRGRTPQPPDAAYQQVLKVFAAEEYPGSLGQAPLYSFASNQPFQANYNAPAGNVATPVIFEPTAQLDGDTLQIWIGLCGTQSNYGSAEVFVSLDGNTYTDTGERLSGSSTIGTLSAALASVTPAATGPTVDNTNTLTVNVANSGRTLNSATMQQALAGATLCYVDGELIAYTTATLTSTPGIYQLTGLVRGMYGSTISAHNAGAQFFAVANGNIVELPYTPDKIGKTLYFKFPSFNFYGGGEQSLASVEAYSYTVQGTALSGPLAAPTNLVTNYSGNLAAISWQEVTGDFRPIQYEIRVGASFAGAQILGRVAHPPFIVPGNGTYWVAAVTQPASGITVYSTPISVTVSGVVLALNSNLLQTWDEFATGLSGTFGGNAAKAGTDTGETLELVLDYTGNVLSVTDWLNDLDILHIGSAGASGTYTTPTSHIVNAGRVAPLTVAVAFTAIGQVPGLNILSVNDWLDDTDILGNAASANISVVPYIATAGSNGVFGSFQRFVPGIYNAQRVEMQLQMASSDPQTQAIVESFSWSVASPDRIDDYVGVTIPSGGLTLTYAANTAPSTPAPFNGGPAGAALPQIQVQLLNAQANDVVTIAGQSLSGATIDVTNGGAGVSRTANILAKGF